MSAHSQRKRVVEREWLMRKRGIKIEGKKAIDLWDKERVKRKEKYVRQKKRMT